MTARVPPEFDAFLAEPRDAILCIAREPGRAPHATPVWFDYVDGVFRVSITRARVKYRLLLAAPQVTLVVDDGPTLRTVIVSGEAEIRDDDASLLALSRELRAKHGSGLDPDGPPDDELLRSLREEQRVVVVIRPEHALSWAGG